MRAVAVMTLGLALAIAAQAQDAAHAQDAAKIKLSGGLEASIGFVGRDKSGTNVTATLHVENTGKAAVRLLLVGDEPQAVDNTGVSYRLSGLSGIARCTQLGGSYLARCIGRPDFDPSLTAPLEIYTQIDPGSGATVTFSFSGNKGGGAALGIAATFAYRIVPDQLADDTLSDEQKRKTIHTLNMSFPAHAITAAE